MELTILPVFSRREAIPARRPVSYTHLVILNALGDGFSIESGNADVDRLLNRGGIMGMMSTVSLALLALGLGEMLQRMGILSAVLSKMEVFIKSPRSLVLTTLRCV